MPQGSLGRAVWDTWSQHSEKYDAQDQERVWKSFKAEGGVTLGTLFHEAARYGYVPPTFSGHSQHPRVEQAPDEAHQRQHAHPSSTYQRRHAARVAHFRRQLYADPYFGAPERRAKGIPVAVLRNKETSDV